MRMNPKPTRLTRLTLKPKPPQCRFVVEWREPERRPNAREDPGPAQTQARLERSGTFILNRVPESADPSCSSSKLWFLEQHALTAALREGARHRRLPGQPLDCRTQSPERSAATGLASQQQCIASWRAMRSRRPPRRCPMTVAGPRRKAPALCWTRSLQPPRRIRAVAALRSTATRAASALRVPKPGCPPTLLRERRASSGARTLRS